jgi:hypothetical protein
MAIRLLELSSALLVWLAPTVALLGCDDRDALASPTGEFEVLSRVDESGPSGHDSFYLVEAGQPANPEDEILRTTQECSLPAESSASNPQTRLEPETTCTGYIYLEWKSAAEVQFVVNDSVRILRRVPELHGVHVSVQRAPSHDQP